MGTITDILKEIPLSAILRERLAEKEAEMAALKSENTELKAENTGLKSKIVILKAQNADLKAKLQKIESNKTIHGDICPYCQQPNGKLLDIKPHKHFGAVGVKVYNYQCENCGKKYEKEKQDRL
jgi:uncharacterized protein with PIN domain